MTLEEAWDLTQPRIMLQFNYHFLLISYYLGALSALPQHTPAKHLKKLLIDIRSQYASLHGELQGYQLLILRIKLCVDGGNEDGKGLVNR